MSEKVRRYAEGTKVPVERSRAEIERLLRRHGAGGFGLAWQGDHARLVFEIRGRRVRFDVPAPPHKEYSTVAKWEAEERRRWRALLLMLKAKLEMVAAGDADFDQEFLAFLVLPSGQTMAQRLLPKLEDALSGKALPPLLGE